MQHWQATTYLLFREAVKVFFFFFYPRLEANSSEYIKWRGRGGRPPAPKLHACTRNLSIRHSVVLFTSRMCFQISLIFKIQRGFQTSSRRRTSGKMLEYPSMFILSNEMVNHSVIYEISASLNRVT